MLKEKSTRGESKNHFVESFWLGKTLEIMAKEERSRVGFAWPHLRVKLSGSAYPHITALFTRKTVIKTPVIKKPPSCVCGKIERSLAFGDDEERHQSQRER